MTAQIARAAQASTVWRAIAWKSRTWDWSSPNWPLPNSNSSSTGQRSPAALTSRALRAGLPLGHVAVVKGQLAGLQVTADQQGVTG